MLRWKCKRGPTAAYCSAWEALARIPLAFGGMLSSAYWQASIAALASSTCLSSMWWALVPL
eukprot:11456077-Prorocentrum_lima.AAC.1